MAPEETDPIDDRIREYWDWIAVALFLLVPVDTLMTFFAAREVGTDAESNPVMAWLLRQGIPTLVAANLAAVVLVAVFFYGVVEMLERTPPAIRPYFARVLEVWIGVLLVAGFAVFANNLVVIVFGVSLV
jgi:hypothetical protein